MNKTSTVIHLVNVLMIVLVCPDLWLKALKYVYYPLNLYNTSIHSIPFEKLIEQQVKTHAKLRIHKLL